ncbi:alpha/beta fold hydrolase, partial [Inquilinus limosus]|uniref:alpha/beta fold hydrolase n=1 Tax=Inquilinus limosus TaxID=171674 RepID=UPI003F18CFC1
MPEDIDLPRRRLFGTALMTLAAAPLVSVGPAAGQTTAPAGKAAIPSGATFGPLKQIDAGDLNVGYVEAGPADGPVVLLLHGWPHDIYSFVDVVPVLTAAGYRVIVPYLRGYGSTRFRSEATIRNGEPAALAAD